MENLYLEKTILFHGMLPQEIESARRALNVYEKKYAKDAAVLLAGSATSWMGMVLEGGVTIESTDLWGNRTILSHVGKGQYFAETYAWLEKETVPVDVIASKESRILFFQIGLLRQINQERETWAAKLIVNLLTISAHKNLALSDRSFHTSSKQIRGRVMAYLNTVSLQKGVKSFDIPFDRQQLADYLNVERTALSKELGKMQKDGLLHYNKNHFTIFT